MTLSTHTRLEKIAADNGFDLQEPAEPGWQAFSSTQCPLRVWLTIFGDTVFIAALSDARVARALPEHGTPWASPRPSGAASARSVTSIPALHALVRRAFQLSRAFPNELLRSFTERTESLPRSTEREQLVIVRVGQEIFRGGLLEYWDSRCAVTGLIETALLRASHIKPWASCESDAERLDVFNGLLLAPHLDAAFDRGYITFNDDGKMRVSHKLSHEDRAILGLHNGMLLRSVEPGHRDYLAWHREHVFVGD